MYAPNNSTQFMWHGLQVWLVLVACCEQCSYLYVPLVYCVSVGSGGGWDAVGRACTKVRAACRVRQS